MQSHVIIPYKRGTAVAQLDRTPTGNPVRVAIFDAAQLVLIDVLPGKHDGSMVTYIAHAWLLFYSQCACQPLASGRIHAPQEHCSDQHTILSSQPIDSAHSSILPP